jgi:phage gp45-like
MNSAEQSAKFREIDQKIAGLINIADVTNPGSDSGLDSISQVEYKGKPINSAMVSPYGLCSNPPKETSLLLFSVGGSPQNVAGIPYFPENRVRNLSPGEVALANFLTEAHIKCNKDGDIEIITKNGITKYMDDGSLRFQNDNGFFELKTDGQFNANDNFTVDPS